jgi:hypothetical protein
VVPGAELVVVSPPAVVDPPAEAAPAPGVLAAPGAPGAAGAVVDVVLSVVLGAAAVVDVVACSSLLRLQPAIRPPTNTAINTALDV